jgi:hypothetical protein
MGRQPRCAERGRDERQPVPSPHRAIFNPRPFIAKRASAFPRASSRGSRAWAVLLRCVPRRSRRRMDHAVVAADRAVRLHAEHNKGHHTAITRGHHTAITWPSHGPSHGPWRCPRRSFSACGTAAFGASTLLRSTSRARWSVAANEISLGRRELPSARARRGNPSAHPGRRGTLHIGNRRKAAPAPPMAYKPFRERAGRVVDV